MGYPRAGVLGLALGLQLTVACGGGDERNFAPASGGTDAGSSGGNGGSATGGTAGSSGGSAGTGGASGSGGASGASGASGSGGTAGSSGAGGLSGASGSGGAATGGAAGSGGTTGCASGHTCVGAPPAGWSGPVTVGTGTTCPSEYATSLADLKDKFLPGTPSCTCNCGSTTVTCGAVTLWDYTQDACLGTSSPIGTITPVSQCVVTNNQLDKQVRIAGSASCLGESVTKNIPSPSWASNAKICGGGQDAGGCSAGQLCVPDPPSGFAGLCVYRTGDFTCPSGFSNRTVYYKSFTDTRNCSACSCNPSGWSCRTTMSIYQSFNCTTAQGPNVTVTNLAPKCTHNLLTNSFKVSTPTSIAGSCNVATNTTLTGTATPQEPTTVCCQ
ncbi:MAG: hypothetical protein R3B13_25370 [Polyangiaceae bacterium]